MLKAHLKKRLATIEPGDCIKVRYRWYDALGFPRESERYIQKVIVPGKEGKWSARFASAEDCKTIHDMTDIVLHGGYGMSKAARLLRLDLAAGQPVTV